MAFASMDPMQHQRRIKIHPLAGAGDALDQCLRHGLHDHERLADL